MPKVLRLVKWWCEVGDVMHLRGHGHVEQANWDEISSMHEVDTTWFLNFIEKWGTKAQSAMDKWLVEF